MLGLKPIIQRLGIAQRAFGAAIGLGEAATAQWLNHGQRPKTAPETLEQDALDYLAAQGATPAELAGALNEVGAATPTQQQPTEGDDMILRKAPLTPAAKKHFGLFRDPFADDLASSDDLWQSPDTRYVRESMFQTARHGGFMAIVGESGAGKSTLRRDLIERIAREAQPIVVVEPYVLAMEDNDSKGKTLRSVHIAEAIINTVAPLEPVKRSPEARFRQLHRVLRDSRRAGNAHVLVIEEAHALPVPTLKHLKRFFELEDGFKKLISIILVGQPELRMKLSEQNHEVREVVQRCELVELPPLDNRLAEYVEFRLGRAGKSLADIAEPGALEALRERLTFTSPRRGGPGVSLLYPLAVGNLLCGALNLAADLGAPRITADIVKEA